MSKLAEDLAVIVQPKSGRPCTTCQWYKELPEDFKKDFDEFLAQPNPNITHLWRVCRNYGLPGGAGALLYHVRTHHSVRTR